jgi:hypothetical protein
MHNIDWRRFIPFNVSFGDLLFCWASAAVDCREDDDSEQAKVVFVFAQTKATQAPQEELGRSSKPTD